MANIVKLFAGNVKLLNNAGSLRSARQFASARKFLFVNLLSYR